MIGVSLKGREVSGRIYLPALFSIRGKDIAISALWDTGAVHSCINEKLVDAGWIADIETPIYGSNDANKKPDEVMA